MTAPAKKIFTVGTNAARVYQLDQDSGLINGSTSAVAYDGLSIIYNLLEYTPAEPESISHVGNNSIQQTDTLPPIEAASGNIETPRTDYDSIVMMNNTNVYTVGNFNIVGWGTNQQGSEPTVGFLAYSQGKLTSGARAWSALSFPKSVIIPRSKGHSRERQNHQFYFQPQYSTSSILGVAYTIGNEGYTSAQYNEIESNYRVHVAQWQTTAGAETQYPFTSTLKFSNNSGGIMVSKNGVLMSYGATADAVHYVADADKITFGAALTSGDVVIAMYELAESAVDVD